MLGLGSGLAFTLASKDNSSIVIWCEPMRFHGYDHMSGLTISKVRETYISSRTSTSHDGHLVPTLPYMSGNRNENTST